MEVELVKNINNGHKNTVRLVKSRENGKTYIHKIFGDFEEYTAELFLGSLTATHPFIAHPVCTMRSTERGEAKPGILFEHIDGLSSAEYVKQPGIGYEDVRRLAAQLLEALEYIHYQGYIHADVKPDNVMITKEGNIKLIDLGFGQKMPHTRGFRGTSSTMAPELVHAVPGPIQEGVDWWAYGSTVAMWNSMIVTRTRRRRFIPLILKQSGETWDQVFTIGQSPISLTEEIKAFLALFFQADPLKRSFNTEEQLMFLKGTEYLRGQFPRLSRFFPESTPSVITAHTK